MTGFVFLSVDPGTAKCGLAVMDSRGAALEIMESKPETLSADLEDIIERFERIDRIVIGDGTGYKKTAETVKSFFGDKMPIIQAHEKNTTLEARRLYEKENPRPWPARLVPFGLFGLPGDMDAWAAVVIGRRYIATLDTPDGAE